MSLSSFQSFVLFYSEGLLGQLRYLLHGRALHAVGRDLDFSGPGCEPLHLGPDGVADAERVLALGHLGRFRLV